MHDPNYRGPHKVCRVKLKHAVHGVPAGTECEAVFYELFNGTVNGVPHRNDTPHYMVRVAGTRVSMAMADVEELTD